MARQGKKLDEQQVRERAYTIWEREGRPSGRDREHWAMAERELAEGLGLPQSIRKPAARKKASSKANASSGTGVAPQKRAASAAKPRATKSSKRKAPRE